MLPVRPASVARMTASEMRGSSRIARPLHQGATGQMVAGGPEIRRGTVGTSGEWFEILCPPHTRFALSKRSGVVPGLRFARSGLRLRAPDVRSCSDRQAPSLFSEDAMKKSIGEKKKPCKNCEGKGTLKKGDKIVRCQRCGGTGIKPS